VANKPVIDDDEIVTRKDVVRAERRVRKQHHRILIGGIFAIVLGVVALQLVPYGRNHSNPPVIREPAWDSLETRALAVRACYDCHSNETVWPWYSNIAPMSMMLYQDVIDGRAVLNFSEWDAAAWNDEQTNRLVEVVAKDQMPLPYYLILHPEAQLTDNETGQLINGMIVTFSNQDE